jgi:hypothetical protein
MSTSLIKCSDYDDSEALASGFLAIKEAAGFYEWHDWSAEQGLEMLVFRVSRKPKYLIAHVERIYYCFRHALNEQLFGALVDLLIVLNRDGKALGKRMINGSKARLTENQFQALINHLNDRSSKADLLPPNRYSVFAKGLQSTADMVTLAKVSGEKEHDALTLARDYVEYSQLDNAIYVLEQAILLDPERKELHNELLSLYRSTRNQAGFERIYEELSRKDLRLPTEWKQLNDFFINLSKDGK